MTITGGETALSLLPHQAGAFRRTEQSGRVKHPQVTKEEALQAAGKVYARELIRLAEERAIAEATKKGPGAAGTAAEAMNPMKGTNS
ncbi:hypothetical protein ACFXQA_10055 [Microbacterium sp. P07]|uniref:hypothetical protein n=1 Tax=Microbacterium sp. P07 TaxID=3366952 RepID=UPI0037460DAB